MKGRTPAVLTALTIVLSVALFAGYVLLLAAFRAVAGFLGGGSLTAGAFLAGFVVILPAVLAAASAVLLRKRPKARAVVVGIALALAVVELSFAVMGVVSMYRGWSVPEQPVPPSVPPS